MKVLCTLRGIPQLYYGSEIGMKGYKSVGDGDIRRDFPGGWPTDSQNAFLSDERTLLQKQYFDFTQQLLQWRKEQPAIHLGKTLHYTPQNDLYVYFRIKGNEKIVVVVNNHSQAQVVDWSRYQQGLAKRQFAVEALTRKTHNLEKPLQIRAKTTMIFELK